MFQLMEFIAFIGEDKENWGQITAIMNRIETEKIILIKNNNVSDFPDLSDNEKIETMKADSSLPLIQLKQYLVEKLKPLLSGEFDVALSIASGTGKEHMALVSALLTIPVGIRLVVYTKRAFNILIKSVVITFISSILSELV